MPIDHLSICIPPSQLEETVKFLISSLGHMGFKEMIRPTPNVVGLGEKAPYLWLSGAAKDGVQEPSHVSVLKGTHIAIRAETKDQVDTFYANAIQAGGVDNGEPGFRYHFHSGYYSAYVVDPSTNINFEVVAHSPADAY